MDECVCVCEHLRNKVVAVAGDYTDVAVGRRGTGKSQRRSSWTRT